MFRWTRTELTPRMMSTRVDHQHRCRFSISLMNGFLTPPRMAQPVGRANQFDSTEKMRILLGRTSIMLLYS